MSRVTGYSCAFDSRTQCFIFRLELKGKPGRGEFVVTSAEAVETLLDLFEDAEGAEFDPKTGEVRFSFEEDEEEDERKADKG